MLRPPRMTQRSFWLLSGIIVLCLVASGLYYRMGVLDAAGVAYTHRLAAPVATLEKQCKDFAALSDSLLFDKEADTPAEKLAVVTQIQTASAKLKQAVATFRRETQDLAVYRFGSASDAYQRARVLHQHTVDVASQIDDVIKNYDALLTYLKTYYPVRQELADYLATFNSLADINVLTGQYDTLLGDADAIERHAQALSAQTPPRSLTGVVNQALALHAEAATDLRALAYSLSPPIDDLIYGAAAQLEAVTAKNTELDTLTFDAALDRSPTIKSVGSLTEITDRIKL